MCNIETLTRLWLLATIPSTNFGVSPTKKHHKILNLNQIYISLCLSLKLFIPAQFYRYGTGTRGINIDVRRGCVDVRPRAKDMLCGVEVWVRRVVLIRPFFCAPTTPGWLLLAPEARYGDFFVLWKFFKTDTWLVFEICCTVNLFAVARGIMYR